MDRELEIAWAGGLFEGEGSFTVSEDKRRSDRVHRCCHASIGMVTIEPLHRFHAAVGIGRIEGPYKRRDPKHQDVWRWIVRGREGVSELVSMLEPYLTSRRLERAREVIAMDTAGRPRLRKGKVIPGRELRAGCALPDACPHGHPYDEVNLYITPEGGYQCRTCKRDNMRKYSALAA